MVRIKRLYSFLIQTFLPLFLMTFFICLFIVLLQFLWKYVDEMVGKGIEMSVLLELFFYAALTMVPMALPLAILLASLMTFGNLGERLELLSIRAAGVSLLRIMRPLVVLIAFVSVGAFFFQNHVLPYSQVKMWSLLFSVRQKSPELDIPEGVFYDEINGYNMFVKTKNRETGMLYDLMIYDMSAGFDNATVIVADSGKLTFTEDKQYLFFTIHNGESFENLKNQRSSSQNVPYRRESFTLKEILIEFDANFNRMDESFMQNQYIGKDLKELRTSIDSMSYNSDSVGRVNGDNLIKSGYFALYDRADLKKDTETVATTEVLPLDSIYSSLDVKDRELMVSRALSHAESIRNSYEYRSHVQKEEKRIIRRHGIEMHKKFTLSFACLIFFFIGAPLGAIIRKGGLGMPVVVSVLLFIFYYIIDNTGYKMARDGVWGMWQGMWLSSMVLLVLGVYLTYNAAKDSELFKGDAYAIFFKKLFGLHEVRKLTMKAVSFEEVTFTKIAPQCEELKKLSLQLLGNEKGKRQSYLKYWIKGYPLDQVRHIHDAMESLVEYGQNSQNQLVISKLMDYPILRITLLYHPLPKPWMGYVALVLVPLSLPIYLVGAAAQRRLRGQLQTILKTNTALLALLEEEQNKK